MQLFRTPHPCKRTSGSMGTGSIADAMHAAPRHLRKSFAVPVPLPVLTSLPPTSVTGAGTGSGLGAITPTRTGPGSGIGESVNIVPNKLTDTVIINDSAGCVEQTTAALKLASTHTHISALSETHARTRTQYSLAFPESDEEAVAVESLSTLVLRPFSLPVCVSPSRQLCTVSSVEGTKRKIAFESLGPAYVPPSTVISVAILPDRLLIVLGSGVVEAYRYYTSETAKTVLAITAGQPPQNRRVYTTQRRRHAMDLARKQKALKLTETKAIALQDTSLLERELANNLMISFEDEPVPAGSKSISGIGTDVDFLDFDSSTGIGANTPEKNKNKNSSLRGTLQTSSSASIPHPHPHPIRHDGVPESKSINDPKVPGGAAMSDGGRTPPKGSAPNVQRRLLSSKDPLVCVERDSSHFDVLPRLPVTKLFLRRDCNSIGSQPNSNAGACPKGFIDTMEQQIYSTRPDHNAMGSSATKALVKSPIQSTSLYTLEQASSLIVFTRNGRLAISGGRVDGSIAVREIDPRTGFILSAADFHAHHHRVIAIAVDSIAFARTDVIASCDAYGQTFVWTISRLKVVTQQNRNSSYVISRRPQRLFRCQPSQHMRCDISWQLGLVVTVSQGVVHLFSVERDERLRAFEFDWEEEIVSVESNEPPNDKNSDENCQNYSFSSDNNDGNHSASTSHLPLKSHTQIGALLDSNGSSESVQTEQVVNEINKNDYHSSDKRNTSGLSSTYKKRNVRNSTKFSNGNNTFNEHFMDQSDSKCGKEEKCREEDECSVARRIAMCDDGIIILHVEVTQTAADTDTDTDKMRGSATSGTETEAPSATISPTSHYILSYTLSGVRTGRMYMSSPVTFLSVPDRGSDIVIAGQEDGTVTIFR